MNMENKIKSLIGVCGVLLVSLFSLITANEVTPVKAITDEERAENGLSFATTAETYKTDTNLKSMPKTFEAIIKIPTTYSAKRAGVIVGNYVDTKNACYNFELNYDKTEGIYPKLFYEFDDTSLGNFNLNFLKVDLPVEEHLIVELYSK